jgi:hypothetical protein
VTADNPRFWSQGDVDRFAADAEPPAVAEILRRLIAEPNDQALAVLRMFLATRHDATMLKPVPSELATRALLSVGPEGVAVLASALLDEDGDVRYRPSVLARLWRVGRGDGLTSHLMVRASPELGDLTLPPETVEAAAQAVRDIFAEALVRPHVFDLVARFAEGITYSMFTENERAIAAEVADVMNLFAEGSIKLSRSILDRFASLIAAELVEERYQEFLAEHPVFLDPLAASVLSKQRLGIEFATDFAVHAHDGRWLLVEIERPQDELFTAADNLTARFTHAFGQVVDFQVWVDDNVAYAQRLMEGIAAPRGLLVMGLRSQLTERQARKFARFSDNSGRIAITTYDDLLERARSLYANVHRRLP